MSFITHNDDGGAAADLGDFLLNKLGAFMVNHALWVANRSPAVLTLPEAELYTHAGTVGTPAPPFVFVRCTGRGLLHGIGTGIDTVQEWFDQPGNPGISPNSTTYSGFNSDPPTTVVKRSQCQYSGVMPSGALAGHYLFTDGDGDTIPGTYVHAVLQYSSTNYRHLWFGMMEKFGTFTEGQYICAHFWDTNSNQDSPYDQEHLPPACITGHNSVSAGGTSESRVNRNPMFSAAGLRTGITWWGSCGADAGGQFGPVPKAFGTINDNTQSVGNGAIVGGGRTFGTTLFQLESNLAAKARPLIPYLFFIKHPFDGGIERWGPIGRVPDAFRINMRFLSANEQLTIGTDTYRIFPLVNKDSTVAANNPYSGFEGIAYRVIPAA
jgi:hypothetical protein